MGSVAGFLIGAYVGYRLVTGEVRQLSWSIEKVAQEAEYLRNRAEENLKIQMQLQLDAQKTLAAAAWLECHQKEHATGVRHQLTMPSLKCDSIGLPLWPSQPASPTVPP